MSDRPEGQAPYREIDAAEAAASLHTYQIIDVREPEEYDGPLGHIEGSVLIPLATLPAHLASVRVDRPVLVVCKAGMRSANACQFLASQGFTDLTNLKGGMMAWRMAEAKRTR